MGPIKKPKMSFHLCTWINNFRPLNLGSLDCAMPTEADLKFKSKSDKNKKLK